MNDAEAARLLGLEHGVLPSWTQGIVITRPDLADNPIIYANHGLVLLTGYSRDQIVGRNCRFLQGADTNIKTVAQIRRAVAGGKRFDGDILNYRRDGRPFWNCLSLGPMRDEAATLYFVGLQFDVSFRHRD